MPVAPIWFCPTCKATYDEILVPADKKCPGCQATLEKKEAEDEKK